MNAHSHNAITACEQSPRPRQAGTIQYAPSNWINDDWAWKLFGARSYDDREAGTFTAYIEVADPEEAEVVDALGDEGDQDVAAELVVFFAARLAEGDQPVQRPGEEGGDGDRGRAGPDLIQPGALEQHQDADVDEQAADAHAEETQQAVRQAAQRSRGDQGFGAPDEGGQEGHKVPGRGVGG